MQRHAIVVRTRELAPTAKTCFLVTPFRKEFRDLRNAIAEAARRLQLDLVVPDEQTGSQQYVPDIHEGIRSAALVVVICAPISESGDAGAREGLGKPSRNVFYELGLAHALGKPTIILAKTPGDLPADVLTRKTIFYQDADVRTDGFVNELQRHMQGRIGIMRERRRLITDPEEEFADESDHWSVVHRSLLEPFFEALQTAEDILTGSLLLQTHLHTAEADLQQLFDPKVDTHEVLRGAREKKIWSTLASDFETTVLTPYFRDLRNRLEAVDNCLDRVVLHTGAAAKEAQKCCTRITKKLTTELLPDTERYLALHEPPPEPLFVVELMQMHATAVATEANKWLTQLTKTLIPRGVD